MSQETDLVLSIVETVAEREGVDVTELDAPIHEAVDTDALESLFATTAMTGTDAFVTFTYCGYSIRVDGSGGIRVSDSGPETTTTKARA